MLVFGKPLSNLTEDDLVKLVENEVAEVNIRELEYKAELPGRSHADIREFLADAVSFSGIGGAIIFGVEDKKDDKGKPTGIPNDIPGLSIENPDNEIARLENVLRDGIDPRLAGAKFHPPIRLKNGNTVLILEIPRSWNGPHAVNYQGHWRFYGRSSTGKFPLDVSQVRNSFVESEGLVDNIRRFKAERLLMIESGEAPMPLPESGKLVLHLIPFQAFSPGHVIDISNYYQLIQNFPLIAGYSNGGTYNLDGLLISSVSAGYTQVFRSGILEAVDYEQTMSRGTIGPEKKPFIPSLNLVRGLFQSISKYLGGLSILGIASPVVLFISLAGVKGYLFAGGVSIDDVPPIDRSIVQLPEILIEDFSLSLETMLKPALDTLWNAGGFPRCSYYDEVGNWKGLPLGS